jgi:hypothetical protein
MSVRMTLPLLALILISAPSFADPATSSRAPASMAPPSRAPATQITQPAQGQPAAQGTTQPPELANTAPEARNTMAERLKTALLAIEPELGHLEPWQKQILEEEAAPQAQRFIKNYTGSSADVDFDSLKNFLHFHAPELLRRVDGKVLGLLKIDATCAKCVENREQIKTMISDRIRRRGLEVTWLTTEDLTAPALPERELEDKLMELANTQAGGPVGAISVHLRTAPVDDIDTAHADDKRLQVLTFLYMKDPNGHELSRNEGKLEVFDTEPLDLVTGRLLTDAFTDLGARVKKFEQDIATSGKAEVEIEVSGIRGYDLYNQVQAALARSLKDEGNIEPRKISRGRAVFALVTSKPAEKIKSQLGNVRLEQSTLLMRGVSQQTIQMELK